MQDGETESATFETNASTNFEATTIKKSDFGPEDSQERSASKTAELLSQRASQMMRDNFVSAQDKQVLAERKEKKQKLREIRSLLQGMKVVKR